MAFRIPYTPSNWVFGNTRESKWIIYSPNCGCWVVGGTFKHPQKTKVFGVLGIHPAAKGRRNDGTSGLHSEVLGFKMQVGRKKTFEMFQFQI